MKPFVKWAGGKRQILNRINEFVKDSIIDSSSDFTYIEPFLGGGAVFFNLQPKRAIINDLNSDLINAYRVIKSDEYLLLIEELKKMANNYKNDADGFYYDTRALDRDENWLCTASNVDKAARMIFLNRTCYNGLYRVNNKGQFNTPIGRYKNPTICDEKNINEIHDYLSNDENKIRIMNQSYEYAIREAKDGDVIYIDPPYDYEDDDGFTKYQMEGFTFDDFIRLKAECDKAIDKGAFVIVSNNATTRVVELFQQDPNYKIFYDENYFNTLRSINCVGSNRKTGREVIIWGMPSNIPIPQANDIEKVIDMAMSDEKLIFDKQKACELLGVSSTRQVSYYLSALMYFRYITHDKKFTMRIKEINHNRDLVIKDMYQQLKNDAIFRDVYYKFLDERLVDKKEVETILLKNNRQKLSQSTIERRASTIKKWIEWMYNLDGLSSQHELK